MLYSIHYSTLRYTLLCSTLTTAACAGYHSIPALGDPCQGGGCAIPNVLPHQMPFLTELTVSFVHACLSCMCLQYRLIYLLVLTFKFLWF